MTGLEDLCDLRFRDEKVGELLPYLLAEFTSATHNGYEPFWRRIFDREEDQAVAFDQFKGWYEGMRLWKRSLIEPTAVSASAAVAIYGYRAGAVSWSIESPIPHLFGRDIRKTRSLAVEQRLDVERVIRSGCASWEALN